MSEKPKPAPHRPHTMAPAGQTPLWIISLFVSLTEAVGGTAVIKTSGAAQIVLLVFFIIFPVSVAAGFFIILWGRPWVFYAPSQYGGVNFRDYIEALRGEQKLVTKTNEAGAEVKIYGRPDRFQLLFKAQGLTWKKSTKALEVPGGCVVQVTTENLRTDGTWHTAEAVTFVPGVRVAPDDMGNEGRLLVYSQT